MAFLYLQTYIFHLHDYITCAQAFSCLIGLFSWDTCDTASLKAWNQEPDLQHRLLFVKVPGYFPQQGSHSDPSRCRWCVQPSDWPHYNHSSLLQQDTTAHQADMFGGRWSQRAYRDCLRRASHLPLTRNLATDGRGLSKILIWTITSPTQRQKRAERHGRKARETGQGCEMNGGNHAREWKFAHGRHADADRVVY